jgi:hypothetical protein
MVALLPGNGSERQRGKGRAMLGRLRFCDLNHQREKNHSSLKQQREDVSVKSEQRIHSVIREPVNSVEQAMDLAIGGEGKLWVERKRRA